MKTSGLLKMAVGVLGKFLLANVLCLMFSISILTLFNNILVRMLCQLMNISIVFFLPYGYCWKSGDKDRKLVKYGEIEEDSLKGLKAGLMAFIPFAVVPVLLLLEKLNVLGAQILYLHRIVSAIFFPLNMTLLPSTLTVAEMDWWQVLASCATVLVYPLIPAFAYILGYREIYLENLFKYKSRAKNKA